MLKPKSKVGSNVRKCRKKLGISQDILSKGANLAFHVVVKIEGGFIHPTIETVKKTSGSTLCVSLDGLIK